jgi:hypothetical protein
MHVVCDLTRSIAMGLEHFATFLLVNLCKLLP